MKNKYLTIYEDLSHKIKSRQLPANLKLPSENELADRYNTSRETIRKALNMLSQQGYIQKIRGKGSIVIDVNKFDFPVSGLVSFKELSNKMHGQVHTSVHELSLNKPDSYIQSRLNIKGKENVWKIVRSREIDGEKIILDRDFIRHSYVPTITKDICENSIYEYIEGELQLSISFAKKEITVEEPTDEDKELLDFDGFQNIVVIRNFVYLDNANLFQYTESRHRPDKFKFVDFARRNH
jgi:GntR family transcriptional regulator, trehalose operon transcriptional repressor